MKVSEVSSNMKDVSLEGTIVEISEPRTVNTRFGQKKVATALIEDETGKINLTLWEDQIEQAEEGKKIKVEGAYVTEWQGKIQLNVGRKGTISIE
ncbi:single-stranded DNA-binding protein [archaeon BMS3Bbin15]|nr:single-stranded DNA-binding protein [archaeon BMS3Bbin15]